MEAFETLIGNSPMLAAAIHNGHEIRPELYPLLNLEEHQRVREEDPYTGYLTEVSDTRIIVNRSRFEVDLNRPREKAVNPAPEDVWGLQVWKQPLIPSLIETSLAIYDQFYAAITVILHAIIQKFGYFVVLDVHTYNYRRESIYIEAAEALNPEINVGTESIPPAWKGLSDAFSQELSRQSIKGQPLDVRENIKFRGGYFPQWVNRFFGKWGFAIALEFKKTFMDEWTGCVDVHHLDGLRTALAKSTSVLREQQITVV